MNRQSRCLAVMVIVGAASAAIAGQGQPGAGMLGQADVSVTQCAQAQPEVTAAIDAAIARLEQARQTNSPAAMRAATDDLQAVLVIVRTRLAPCAGLRPGAADPHAGHAMPNLQPAPPAEPSTPAVAPGSPMPAPRAVAPAAPAPVASDPHAGHAMPARGSVSAPARRVTTPPPQTKPPTAKPPVPAADPHAGHAMPDAAPTPVAKASPPTATQPALVEDPVSKTKVDPRKALRVLYQGKMYYFRSDKERQEFMRNPKKYIAAK